MHAQCSTGGVAIHLKAGTATASVSKYIHNPSGVMHPDNHTLSFLLWKTWLLQLPKHKWLLMWVTFEYINYVNTCTVASSKRREMHG